MVVYRWLLEISLTPLLESRTYTSLGRFVLVTFGLLAGGALHGHLLKFIYRGRPGLRSGSNGAMPMTLSSDFFYELITVMISKVIDDISRESDPIESVTFGVRRYIPVAHRTGPHFTCFATLTLIERRKET